MTTSPAPIASTVESRNEAVLEYYPMVERLAYRVASTYGLPTGLETEDLVSHGVLGLVEAYERFDPTRGVPFESYAIPRIRGAIVDAIRHVDWVPRKVRARVRREKEITAALTNELGRTPTSTEVEERLGVHTKSTKRRAAATLLALENTVTRDSSGAGAVTISETLADVTAEEPGSAMEHAELRRDLVESVNKLGERDKFILTLYYFQNVPLTEIASVLGVTESRVSQLHMRALGRLRERLDVE